MKLLNWKINNNLNKTNNLMLQNSNNLNYQSGKLKLNK